MVTYLGIRMAGFSENGVMVQSAMPDSPAMLGGIKAGDVIVSINGTKMRPDADPRLSYLRKHIQSRRAGDKLTVTVERDGKEKTLEIVLGEIGRDALEQR